MNGPKSTRRDLLLGLGAGIPLGCAARAPAKPAGAAAPAAVASAAAAPAAQVVQAPLTRVTPWSEVRARFMVPPTFAYLNTGTLGACPRDVLEATTRAMRELEEKLVQFDYRNDREPPLSGYDSHDAFRAPLARFMGAALEEIALMPNSTIAMSVVANGIDLGKGDEIIITDQEHPGGLCPWQAVAKRRGAVIKVVPIDPRAGTEGAVRAFAKAMGPRTRVLVASHLTSGLGLLLPARELCKLARERKALSVIDGAQTLGQIALDVHDLGCDYYVTSAHKWLCAPKGTGALYVQRERLERTTTLLASVHWENRAWGAARLGQYGTGSMATWHGLSAALAFQEALGRDRIEARARELTRRLREGLARVPKAKINSAIDPAMVAAVTTFAIEGKTGIEVEEELLRARVRVRAMGGELGVRCGTQFYVSEDDVDRLVETVARL